MKKKLIAVGLVVVAGIWGLSGTEACPEGRVEIPSHEICVIAADEQNVKDLIASPTIEAYLEGKTAKDKAKWKAVGIFITNRYLKTFTKDGIKVDVELVGTDDKDRLVVVMTASQGGVELIVNNPYYYINPPILVPDSNGTVIRTSTIDGVETIHKYREDTREVLKILLIDNLKLQNERIYN